MVFCPVWLKYSEWCDSVSWVFCDEGGERCNDRWYRVFQVIWKIDLVCRFPRPTITSAQVCCPRSCLWAVGTCSSVLIFPGQTSWLTIACGSTHPVLGPGSPDHHPTQSCDHYLVPVHCFELRLHRRVCLLSACRGHSPILHGALGRGDTRGLPTVGEGREPPTAPRWGSQEWWEHRGRAGWAEIKGTECTWKRVDTDVGGLILCTFLLSEKEKNTHKNKRQNIWGRIEAGRETGGKWEQWVGMPRPRRSIISLPSRTLQRVPRI